MKELRKLSESGIYETIELKEIKKAAIAVIKFAAMKPNAALSLR